MLKVEERHLIQIQAILAKYPYTFYAFGSRAKGNPKRLSDLDLCFFEDIPYNIQAHIDEDFEESDLPFTVDVVNWHACDATFQAKILPDLVLVQASSMFLAIEDMLYSHFNYLPEEMGYQFSKIKAGRIVNCGLGSSMFNVAYNSKFERKTKPSGVIRTLIYMWDNLIWLILAGAVEFFYESYKDKYIELLAKL